MQKKFGTVLNNMLLEQAKEFCLKQHTTLNHLFEDAISEYLQRKKKNLSSGLSSVEASFGILKVGPKTLKSILQEDIYETD